MKNMLKILASATALVVLAVSCEKVKDLPVYGSGKAPVLTVSNATIAPAPADSNNTVLTLNWTNPELATDSSNYKYVVQMDSSGRNFSRAVSKTIFGRRTASYTAKELNTILLNYGAAYNTAYDLDVRVLASYGNNNDLKISNTAKVNFKTYLVPPKVQPPTSGRLFLVGSASQGGWNNPVPVPTQEFGKIDSVTYVGVFQMNGGSEYLVLPVNGSWDTKYSVANNTVPGLNQGGDFGFNLNDNFPGPSAAGLYKIFLNFQSGKFNVSSYNGPAIPNDLFIVGNATPGGWTNPVPVPAQQFTRLNSVEYSLTLPLNSPGEYLFLPTNGSWDNKYAVPNNTLTGLANGGFFGYNVNDNFPGPSASGTYKIDVNFGVNSATEPNRAAFKLTRQ